MWRDVRPILFRCLLSLLRVANKYAKRSCLVIHRKHVPFYSSSDIFSAKQVSMPHMDTSTSIASDLGVRSDIDSTFTIARRRTWWWWYRQLSERDRRR